MQRGQLLFIILFLLPFTFAAQDVSLTVSERGMVEEHVTLSFTSQEAYDTIEFRTAYEPLAVLHNNPSTVRQQDGYWVVELETPVQRGENNISFTLVLDAVVEKRGEARVLAFTVDPVLDDLTLTLTLPEKSVLADTTPAVSPQPTSITTDGRRLMLTWEADEAINLIVLYEKPSAAFSWSGLLLALVILGGAAATLWYRRRGEQGALRATLTRDEQTLVDALRNGAKTQKELVQRTDWSKSKMSKVVRRLEEKGVVEKRPHMRTNRLSLTKAWR